MALPVIIGASRTTDKKFVHSPFELFAQSIDLALADAGVADRAALAGAVSDMVTVRMAYDERVTYFQSEGAGGNGGGVPGYRNLAYSLARKVGMGNTKRHFATTSGGNTPQMLVNMFAEKIAAGECDCVVIVGGEALGTFMKTVGEGEPAQWGDDTEKTAVGPALTATLGHFHKNGVTEVEQRNNMVAPRQVYPLLEQSYRATVRKTTASEHMLHMGTVFSKFSKVASQQRDISWFPKYRTPEEIATEAPSNRWICYPYTKYLNSVMNVNQAGCIILTSDALAAKLGVPQRKRVYLRGSGDCIEPGYFVTKRERLGDSVAMRESMRAAFAQAKLTSRDVSFFDLYSCFPIAVEVACDELGIDPTKETRPLTVTGGLPYAGGPGNAYVIMSIAAMVHTLRAEEDASKVGLVNGNGWFLTKHSTGIYSRQPPSSKTWSREAPATTQKRADGSTRLVQVAERPNGEGVVETYVVDLSSKEKAPSVLVVGRLAGSEGSRFVANCWENLDRWMEKDAIGARVRVETDENGKSRVVAVLDSFDAMPASGIKAPAGLESQPKSKARM